MTMREIVREVSNTSGIPVADILGDSRKAVVTRARQEAMVRCRELGKSTTQVGMFFGRDHSTVTHAERRWRDNPTP